MKQRQFLEVLDRDEAERRWRKVIDAGRRDADRVPLADALGRAASLEPAAVRQALAETDLATVFGPVKFTSRPYSTTEPHLGDLVRHLTNPMVQRTNSQVAEPVRCIDIPDYRRRLVAAGPTRSVDDVFKE